MRIFRVQFLSYLKYSNRRFISINKMQFSKWYLLVVSACSRFIAMYIWQNLDTNAILKTSRFIKKQQKLISLAVYNRRKFKIWKVNDGYYLERLLTNIIHVEQYSLRSNSYELTRFNWTYYFGTIKFTFRLACRSQ